MSGLPMSETNGSTPYTPRTPLSARRNDEDISRDDGDVDRRQKDLYSKQQHILREQRSQDQEKLLIAISGELTNLPPHKTSFPLPLPEGYPYLAYLGQVLSSSSYTTSRDLGKIGDDMNIQEFSTVSENGWCHQGV